MSRTAEHLGRMSLTVASRALVLVIALVLSSAVAAGCGGEDGDNAVEAREQNEIVVDGLRYRVPIFRQLNPSLSPDAAYYEGPPAPEGSGVYAAFVRVCNPSSPVKTPAPVHLEDAFGERFAPVHQPDNRLGYERAPLRPGDCVPSENAAGDAEGAVVAWVLPFEDTAERPMVLVIESAAEEDGRIQLDL